MAQIYEAFIQKLAFQHFNIICGVASKSNNEEKSTIDGKIIKLLDDARDQFETGFPTLGIPPLDPLILEDSKFSIYHKAIINADIVLYNITISGLKEYFINDLSVKISELTVDFDVTIPELVITLEFDVDGKVAGIIPYKPRGEAKIEISDITARGVANLATNNGTLMVKAFHVTLEINKTKVNIAGLLGRGLINKMVNVVFNRYSNRYIQSKKDELADMAAAFIIDFSNSILKNIKLVDLINC